MTWLALCDFTNSAFMDPKLSKGDQGTNNVFARTSPPTGIATGSLIVEVEISAERTGQIVLLEYSAVGDWNQRFSLRLDPTGQTVLEMVNGQNRQTMSVATGTSMRDRSMRITYSWDMKHQRSLLTIENLLEGVLVQAEKRTAIEFPIHIVERLTVLRQTTRADSATVFFGISDRVEPVGLAATIAAGAPVMTPRGPKAIERLRVGDEILTRDNGPQIVRWVGSRHVPTKGSFQPLRLSAPYFGLTHDLLVAPEQRLLVGGAEVEYLFGEEEILVEARHLVNGRTAFKESRFSAIQYYQVLLDNHEVIDVSGGSLESLYTGSICDDPELLQTTLLAKMPAGTLPRHLNLARPLLRSYEALSLRSALMG
ncbi:Hint domain-containing protein [Falsihalocynthiibacter arcticus]|uniref:Hedgehog/Intein (Hint) domain-containing protein n=1 Tax=Falsihalocynthiibacter arcticus TaxID=1579316 RepID=A0A126UZD4_9RHOB|nr:Hint domain-containing protein [Falsihalocynthiibacter arcticus]AML50996.1 hypothetical protein RC74_06655 [Falsihalocynthiibacter arcticus]